jgi:hypothetical protein
MKLDKALKSPNTIDDVISEWMSMKRSMGCVSATDWFCKRVN